MVASFVELSIPTIPCMKVLDYTVEPRLTATSIIRSPRYYGQFFFLARQNGHTFPYKRKALMRSPRYYGHFFLARHNGRTSSYKNVNAVTR